MNGNLPTYLSIQEIANRASHEVDNELDIVITPSFFKLVEPFKKIIVSKSLKDGIRYLVQPIPFDYYSEVDFDDEDFDIIYDEYCEREDVPDCVYIEGYMIVLKGE